MLDEIMAQAVEILAPAVATLIVALLALAAAYLRRLTAQIESDVARRALDSAIAEAHIVAATAVRETQQVLVDEWRRGREDGTLTAEEREQALQAARDAFLRVISQRSLDVLTAALGPIEDWLDDLLEAQVQAIKADSNSIKAKVQAMAAPKS